MDISLKLSILVVATILTGLSAGLCFTWTNSITTGLSRLDSLNYLAAFQQMNRSILNPAFFTVFFGPVIAIIASAILYRNASTPIFWLLIASAGLYIIGVAMVTIFGNVPINEILDTTDLEKISSVDAEALRMKFENQWVRLHLIRTYTSIISFVLLVLVCIWRNAV